MEEKKKAAYRLGVITFVILAVLTVAEYYASVGLAASAVIMFIIAFLKAGVIVQNFMHISRLWREEGH